MTIDDILARLAADGYEGCHVAHWAPKSIIVPGLGEVELAHGEAKLFDKKHPWPEYGDHQCTKSIDDLFADIHATWPLTKETPCETSSNSSPSSSPADAEETAAKDAVLALATGDASDPPAVEPEGVPAGAEAPAVRVGVDANQQLHWGAESETSVQHAAVYMDGDTPIAVAVVTRHDDIQVFVRKSRRREGIGRKLVEHMRARMGDRVSRMDAGTGTKSGSREFWRACKVPMYD